MPIGARNLARCLSAAKKKITEMSSKVMNISMKRPRATEVPGLSVEATARGYDLLVSRSSSQAVRA
jgi:hypothetical protein